MNGRVGRYQNRSLAKIAAHRSPACRVLCKNYGSASLHKAFRDWVFANNDWPTPGQQNILQRHLRPAALRAGIGKIGWHTFRHSYSTMLRGAGADIKVQQELLRHSTIQSTMNTYTQAISEQKRSANSIVVGILFNENASTDHPSANGS